MCARIHDQAGTVTPGPGRAKDRSRRTGRNWLIKKLFSLLTGAGPLLKCASLSGETHKKATQFGALAQLGERNTGSVEVSGSIPLGSTKQKNPASKGAGFLFGLNSEVEPLKAV